MRIVPALVAALFALLLVCSGCEIRDDDGGYCPDCDDGCCPLREQARWLPWASDAPEGTYLGVVLDLPPELRTRNWGGGSCVHASNVTLLKWQGQMEMADWWRRTYSGGEYDDRLISRLEAAGVRYAFAHGGADRDRNGRDDGEEFIEWCVRTRRGAGIFYKPVHSINLIGLDEQYAYLLDNNATDYPERNGHPERVPREQFFRQWHGYGGFAWTLVYDPPPPHPFIARSRLQEHSFLASLSPALAR